jgi:hypothetical protein
MIKRINEWAASRLRGLFIPAFAAMGEDMLGWKKALPFQAFSPKVE